MHSFTAAGVQERRKLEFVIPLNCSELFVPEPFEAAARLNTLKLVLNQKERNSSRLQSQNINAVWISNRSLC
jgi:hypothetical protein